MSGWIISSELMFGWPMSVGLMSDGLMSDGLMTVGLMSDGLMSDGLMSDGLMCRWLMLKTVPAPLQQLTERGMSSGSCLPPPDPQLWGGAVGAPPI